MSRVPCCSLFASLHTLHLWIEMGSISSVPSISEFIWSLHPRFTQGCPQSGLCTLFSYHCWLTVHSLTVLLGGGIIVSQVHYHWLKKIGDTEELQDGGDISLCTETPSYMSLESWAERYLPLSLPIGKASLLQSLCLQEETSLLWLLEGHLASRGRSLMSILLFFGTLKPWLYLCTSIQESDAILPVTTHDSIENLIEYNY